MNQHNFSSATDLTLVGRVVSLWRYPVSSLSGEQLESLDLSPQGVTGDRTHGLFDVETDLAIYPAKDTRWNAAPLVHARWQNGDLQLSVDGTQWQGADDPTILDRIGTVLGRPVHLRAYGSETRHGAAAPRYKIEPIHLISRQGLATLQAVLPDTVLDECRFRPNIVVDLPDSPDGIPEYRLLGQEFSIGDLHLRGTDPCVRCGFTSLRQPSLPEDPRVLRTLVKEFQRNFGIYCEALSHGRIALGDAVSALLPPVEQPAVVIVGAGQAGAMAGRHLRQHGFMGPIRLVGEERHIPYERPPLSKSLFAAPAPIPVLAPAEAAALDIDLHLQTAAVAIDRERRAVELADGTILPYGHLILATGGLARRAPGLDRGFGRVHVLRTLDDAQALGRTLTGARRVFVHGGGWIGMELAAVARQAGCAVTLFARADRLAPRVLPPEVSRHLADLHRDHGVDLRLGTDPQFRETADHVLCRVNGEEMTADLLVVAIGMVANDGLARRAGLACRDGVLTDACGATSDSRIFAIGDVSRQPCGDGAMRIESWQNANLQAERAALTILGREADLGQPLSFWSEQFGHRLQIAGLPDPAAPLREMSGVSEKPLWDYGSFAIGIDCPDRISRFLRGRRAPASVASAVSAPEVAADAPAYAAPRVTLEEGAMQRIEVEGLGPILLIRLDDRLHAVDDTCPHATASLAEGFVEDRRIVCPLHFAEFDLSDGTPHNAPAGCPHLTCYAVEEAVDGILLRRRGHHGTVRPA